MDIVYSTDENYARHCGTSIYSLFYNNRDIKEINVFVIENDVGEETKEKFYRIAEKFGRNIEFFDINKICKDFPKNNDFPKAAFARLFVENMKKSIDRILYIDCDTIINGSLKELWNINIDNYYIGAIQDSIQSFKMKIIGLNKEFRYINSGVLLINLKKWKEENLKEEFIKCMKKYKGKVPHHDQGVLNIVCSNKILYLHPKYNLMPEMLCMTAKQLKKLYRIKEFYTEEELREGRKNPIIIHYITKWYNRPWYKSCTHPLKEKYIQYLNETDFNKTLLEGNLKKRILLQKQIFEKMPFLVFILFQRLFDMRRKILISTNVEKEK